jgi:hypothetical protein
MSSISRNLTWRLYSYGRLLGWRFSSNSRDYMRGRPFDTAQGSACGHFSVECFAKTHAEAIHMRFRVVK